MRNKHNGGSDISGYFRQLNIGGLDRQVPSNANLSPVTLAHSDTQPRAKLCSMAGNNPTPSDGASGGTRARGRGRGRGGLGKYLRARGRGRGFGKPAEFGKRLVLEGEEVDEEEDEEAAAERARKFSRRQLGSNADRYVEPEPELGSDGMGSLHAWCRLRYAYL